MMAHGILLPRDIPASEVVHFARHVEDLGFQELWVVEDRGFRGGVAQAAAVLASTTSLRVGIGILPAAVRNVVFAAMEVATLAQLFPRRIDVGLGHGMPAWLDSVGARPSRPLSFLEEYVQAMTALLRGERVAADGRIDVRDVALEPSALPDVVPDIFLGVRGPKSLAVSGRLAAGTVLAEPSSPEYVRVARAQIDASSRHRIVAYNVAVVADTNADAFATARPALQYVGDDDWGPHIAPLPFASELADLRTTSRTRTQFAERLPDEWVAQLALAGTPSTVRRRLRQLGEAGVTSSVMIPVGPDPFSAVTSFAQLID
ncbi:LLM class flavin-dependent oxidoreductase [Subtercola boreus]|nr:LLM class flavin-dependent oxidoreductase [Subtercola boreus]